MQRARGPKTGSSDAGVAAVTSESNDMLRLAACCVAYRNRRHRVNRTRQSFFSLFASFLAYNTALSLSTMRQRRDPLAVAKFT